MAGYGYKQQDEYDMAVEVWRRKAAEARERAAWRETARTIDGETWYAYDRVPPLHKRGSTWMPRAKKG